MGGGERMCYRRGQAQALPEGERRRYGNGGPGGRGKRQQTKTAFLLMVRYGAGKEIERWSIATH